MRTLQAFAPRIRGRSGDTSASRIETSLQGIKERLSDYRRSGDTSACICQGKREPIVRLKRGHFFNSRPLDVCAKGSQLFA
jgi:hypothetical protein